MHGSQYLVKHRKEGVDNGRIELNTSLAHELSTGIGQ
jgi:hypothetical protein